MTDEPGWEKEMEEYVKGMSDEEVREFLKDTKYEFYKNVKSSFLGLDLNIEEKKS